MIKLAALTAFLVQLDYVAAENIDSWVEDPRVIPSGKQITANSIILFRNDYRAVFYIERFPHQRHSANLLFGQVCAWLMTNDPERDEIAQPNMSIDILDNDTADVEISIEFEEDVTAVKDPDGTIVYNGETYSLGEDEIDVAESGEVES